MSIWVAESQNLSLAAEMPRRCDACICLPFTRHPRSSSSPVPCQCSGSLVFIWWRNFSQSLLLHWDLEGEAASLSFMILEIMQVMVAKLNKPLPTNGKLEDNALPRRSFSVTLGKSFTRLLSIREHLFLKGPDSRSLWAIWSL